MNVISITEEAFFELIELVVQRLRDSEEKSKVAWLSDEQAMKLLNIKSKTTLQKLRDEGRIRFSQPQKKIILYDRESIEQYLNKHARNTF